jgi:hypothetical protein
VTAWKASAAGYQGAEEAIWHACGRNPVEAAKALEDAVAALEAKVEFYFPTRRIL